MRDATLCNLGGCSRAVRNQGRHPTATRRTHPQKTNLAVLGAGLGASHGLVGNVVRRGRRQNLAGSGSRRDVTVSRLAALADPCPAPLGYTADRHSSSGLGKYLGKIIPSNLDDEATVF